MHRFASRVLHEIISVLRRLVQGKPRNNYEAIFFTAITMALSQFAGRKAVLG